MTHMIARNVINEENCDSQSWFDYFGISKSRL